MTVNQLLMFPKISKSFEIREDVKTFKQGLIDNFGTRKSLFLVNKNDLQEDRFILRKKSNFLNPFEPKLLFVEVKGVINEKFVHYEIRMNSFIKVIITIDIFILTIVTIVMLISGEIMMALLVAIFIFVAVFFTIWKLKSELKLLDKETNQFLVQTE